MLVELRGILYYLFVQMRYNLIIFWSILLGILGISLVLGNTSSGDFYFAMPFPIYVYSGIIAYISVKTVIPYLIKLGAVRKTLFIGLGISFLGIAIFNSLLSNALVEIITVTASKEPPIYFMHIDNFFTNTFTTRIVIDVAVILVVTSMSYLFALINKRFGLIAVGGVTAILILAVIIGVSNDSFIEQIFSLITNFRFTYFYSVLGIGIILYGASYLLISRFTVKE